VAFNLLQGGLAHIDDGQALAVLIPRKTTTYSGVKATTCSMA